MHLLGTGGVYHCGISLLQWIANCVGEKNLRYFMGFLFFTPLCLAVYMHGAYLCKTPALPFLPIHACVFSQHQTIDIIVTCSPPRRSCKLQPPSSPAIQQLSGSPLSRHCTSPGSPHCASTFSRRWEACNSHCSLRSFFP